MVQRAEVCLAVPAGVGDLTCWSSFARMLDWTAMLLSMRHPMEVYECPHLGLLMAPRWTPAVSPCKLIYAALATTASNKSLCARTPSFRFLDDRTKTPLCDCQLL